MGRKKQLPASHHKPSSSSSSSTVDQTSSSSTPPPSDDIKAVRDAKRALAALHQGNQTKAEKIVKKSLSKYKDSPILHRVNSELQLNLSINDSASKFKHLNNSAESAQRATTLSPNSLSFSLFYIKLLFDLSKHNKEYDKMIRECNRALSIKIEESERNLKNEIRKLKMTMTVIKIIDEDGDIENRIKKKDNEIENLIIKRKKEKIEAVTDYFDFGFETCGTSNCRMKELRKYWNEKMSDESKMRLLEVRIDEVKEYFDKTATRGGEIFKEAIGYAEKNGNWKFWECCFCGEKFVDCNIGMNHYEEMHLGVLNEKLKSFVPCLVVDFMSIDLIKNGDWRPVDTIAAAEMIRSRLNVDNELKWPLSNDIERAKILTRIHCMFKLFLRHKCLAVTVIGRVVGDARRKLDALIPQSEFQIHELDETLHCLRFLGVSELNNVVKFLQEVCDLCGLSDDDDEGSDKVYKYKVFDIKERITFSSDFKCLVLDKRLLRKELIIGVVGDSSEETSAAVDDYKDDLLPIVDDNIINWLFCFPIEEQLESWTQRRGDKHGGKKVFEVLATEFSNIKSLCERKKEIYNNVMSVRDIEARINTEVTRRRKFPESEIQSYAFILRKRRKEIIKMDDGAVFKSSQFILDAIRDVLEEALSLSNQFIFEDCVKDDDQMMRRCLAQANYYIQEAIRRLQLRLFDELAKIDAMIMRSVAVTQQFKLKLRQMCAYDYRSIMLPLLKLFIKEHLENLVDKDLRKHTEFKATGGNQHFLLHQEDAELVDVPVSSIISVDELENLHRKLSPEIVHKIEKYIFEQNMFG